MFTTFYVERIFQPSDQILKVHFSTSNEFNKFMALTYQRRAQRLKMGAEAVRKTSGSSELAADAVTAISHF